MKTQTQMQLPMHKKIKGEARAYQQEYSCNYTKALYKVSQKYGYKNYNVFKVILDKNNKNPFNIEFDIFKLDRPDKNLSFREKIAQSISMLGNRLRKRNIRKYIISDFDIGILCKTKYILSLINDSTCVFRIRHNDYPDYDSVSFIEFDFEKEETVLYIKTYSDTVDFYKKLFYSNKQDFIFRFILEAFPFYNVSKIILLKGKSEGIEISKEGTKQIEFSNDYFQMGCTMNYKSSSNFAKGFSLYLKLSGGTLFGLI